MIYDLPLTVKINGKDFNIRNKCDYRVILDCINALNDINLEPQDRVKCALFIFYEDINGIQDFEAAINEMMSIISYGETSTCSNNEPKIMDWEHDFKHIAPAVSKNLGYDIRMPEQYVHWWTLVGAYMNIGEGSFATIISIRNKKLKGKKLEKWEEEFYRNNKSMVDLPQQLTEEEQAELNSPW